MAWTRFKSAHANDAIIGRLRNHVPYFSFRFSESVSRVLFQIYLKRHDQT